VIGFRAGRAAFVVAFIVLLLDGVGAVWLGQLTGHRSLLVVGIVLLGAALSVGLLYQRWIAALEEVEAARRDLMRELGALRRAVEESRAGRPGQE
jgi:hypothetical protein